MFFSFQRDGAARDPASRVFFVLWPVEIRLGSLQIRGARDGFVAEVKGFIDQRAVPEPDAGASVKSAVHRSNLHVKLAVVVPVILRARSVIHAERTKETPVVVPFPAHAVQ